MPLEDIPVTPDQFPKQPYGDRTNLGWDNPKLRVESENGQSQLLVFTLTTGIDMPVFVRPNTNHIIPKELGIFHSNEDFRLSSGWKVVQYSSGYDSNDRLHVQAIAKRERKIREVELSSGYLADAATHDLRWHYEAQDNEQFIRINIGTNTRTDYDDDRVLEGSIKCKSKVTGHTIKFEFDAAGELNGIEVNREPIENRLIVIDPSNANEATGKSVGEEVGMSLFGDQVDMDDYPRVSEICKQYLGVIPKEGEALRMDLHTTMKSLIDNIQNSNKNAVVTNPRGLLAFDSSSIQGDLRSLAT